MQLVKLIRAIDRKVEEDEGRKKGRTHLGASVLGKKCLRQVWYGWRWAHITKHQGRLLRLFKRGHREEASLEAYLKSVGLEIRSHAARLCYYSGQQDVPRYIAVPWDAPIPEYYEDVSASAAHIQIAEEEGVPLSQITFSKHRGHFGGSCDGMLHGMDAVIEEWGLNGPGQLEYKTHGEKSFIDLAGKLEDWRKHVGNPDKYPFTGKGVISSKIEHYVQMQTYMKNFGLRWALYVAVCKNTDDMYIEVVQYKPEVADAYDDRALAVIDAQHPPKRITEDPSWWECKFCDFREVCHHGKMMQKNCRSCVNARPVDDGEWYCDHYHAALPKDFMPKGCDQWVPFS